jgi:hypothetical protein
MYLYIYVYICVYIYVHFLVVLGFELKASHLIGALPLGPHPEPPVEPNLARDLYAYALEPSPLKGKRAGHFYPPISPFHPPRAAPRGIKSEACKAGLDSKQKPSVSVASASILILPESSPPQLLGMTCLAKNLHFLSMQISVMKSNQKLLKRASI